MTSGNDAPEAIDPRLAEARDSVLHDNERIIAQAEGDPGQAIVLTETRLITIRVGITATGEADGHIIRDFPLGEITAVNVRKGPLGAVIQVVSADSQPPAPGSSPNKVIVFTGADRIKKCEAMAAAIEPLLGKPLGRVEAEPAAEEALATAAEPPKAVPETPLDAPKEPRRGGREPRTLADEIFAELNHAEAPEETSPAPPPAQAASDEVPPPAMAGLEQVEEPQEELAELLPNPNLPKPVKKGHGPLVRMLVLMGLLMAAILVTVSVTSPLRQPQKTVQISIDVNTLTASPEVLRKRLAELTSYQAQVAAILKPCRTSVTALTMALKSGDASKIKSALCEKETDQCWQKISELEAPAGQTAAKESIVTGVLTFRSAVTEVAGRIHSSAATDAADVLQSLKDGQNSVDRGLANIEQKKASMRAQLAKLNPRQRDG